ncbi:short-chain collagen C4-like [Pomacea canaliculata]|uniref:short-chain collagen C4-like n=1 Tax=Pomacea canaliculata TaxID=400727 RepID=UPI000D72EB12|nr:short-chain collagen C4-like [Pomacea canaliculata]
MTVYSGYMGGSWYTDPGSGANYLCLPPNPAGGIIAKPASYSHLGGTEYEVSNRLENNQDALCAVCFVKNRSSNIMIPGTNSCPSGWTTEYTGLLMTGNNAHAGSSEFICVDSKLEGRIDSNADRDGRLLLLVASFCGSLPCPPYQNNNILQCVVCSK